LKLAESVWAVELLWKGIYLTGNLVPTVMVLEKLLVELKVNSN